ncbi:MAG: aldo/keto reductase [Acidobacteriaceae bacterium]|nr:aldo/keto reductase [Acidobacteriaceae bacterium]
MQRRDFIKTATTAAGMAVSTSLFPSLAVAADEGSGMIYRTLGSTGERVSAIGLGGYHIGKSDVSEEEGIRLIRAALDRGMNFLDNCWDYNGGVSEIRMGKALKDGYRQKAFVMTKIDGRTRDAAAKQIDESLQRLQTDHVDLMQFHEVIRLEDPDRIFAEGGAMEAMLAAKQAGKVRFIGFTGHKDPYVHLRMLAVAKAHNFHFDAVQMPLNVMDAHFRSFGEQVVPVLVREKIGILGMKCFGDRYILDSNTGVKPIECLHYCLNLPVSVQITGIDSPQILDQAFEAASTFRPMSQQEVAALLDKTKQAAMAGKFELYKTTSHFDGTGQNPAWLG